MVEEVVVELSRKFLTEYMKGRFSDVSPLLHPNAIVRGIDEWIQSGLFCWVEDKKYEILLRDVNTIAVEGAIRLEECCGKRIRKREGDILFLWECLESEWRIRSIYAYGCQEECGWLNLHTVDGEEMYIHKKEIFYIEALQSNVRIYCRQGSYDARTGIQQLGERLGGQFIQIHRSFIVNTEYVEAIRRYEARITGGTCLPIPEKRYQEVKRRIRIQKEV